MENPISEFLQTRIEARDFPSAVYLVAEKGEIIFQDALGFAVVEPEKIEAKIDTIYDLASLTKVLVTGLLCAELEDKKQARFSSWLRFYFPQFRHSDKRLVSIKDLLLHISGLCAWKPFYLLAKNKEEILQVIIRETREYKPETKVVYSDLNFITLGFLLEQIYEQSLEEIARKEIFEPLNLENTFYNPPKDLQKRIAASEKGNEFEKQTCIEQGYAIRNPQSSDLG